LIPILVIAYLSEIGEIAADGSLRKVYGLTCFFNASLSDEN